MFRNRQDLGFQNSDLAPDTELKALSLSDMHEYELNVIDIYLPNHSYGLRIQAEVLKTFLQGRKVRVIRVPWEFYAASAQDNARNIQIDIVGGSAIFIEKVFEHGPLEKYQNRILLPNPEWLTPLDLQRCLTTIDTVWHMTRHSQRLLTPKLPNHKHVHLGFTSLERTRQVTSYETFAHLPGKAKTRHTQDIINIWTKNAHLPRLRLQFYNDLSIPQWVQAGNIEFFMGFLGEEAYAGVAENFGIHLCPSQMEGFGHYINESRSSAALIVTLDAPPMNEMVTPECGILVPIASSGPHHLGERFWATEQSIADAVETCLSMSEASRRALGQQAQRKFREDRNLFVQRFNDAI